MAIGLFVIGDEILSGKRQDKHLSRVIELLAARGMALAWARFLGDDEQAIADALCAAVRDGDVVLSCGGIGATPDDRTRQAAALAFERPLERHAEAEALILAQYGEVARPNRVLMADFPSGAGLIPNPVNRVAGFFVGDCNFVPGFPEMAWPMLEWVLDQRYAKLHLQQPPVEYRLRVVGTSGEGDLLPLMEETLQRFPGIKLSSLPSRGDAERARHIEFGFRGSVADAAAAYRHFELGLRAWADIAVEALAPPPAGT
ncbi:competence/damage-inducible protein A [Sinimarinibacterium sp. CAU 1509]|uniref:competence/damage-inducible protein A n=1 Tax=Sinimarinibacterium sp. CAU 1509 TaxID=2562283 RepID=UPI0010ADA2F7|nr:molybdopterin-binding protein [Sinimarinibacterium sp. CAU 1509]TJY60885.1 competence/damage-inducible protein A [Sinimarinibacterium sp. CAU 1509]